VRKKLLVAYDSENMPPQCYQLRNNVVLTAIAYGMPLPDVVPLNADGTLPSGIRESDYDGCVVVAPAGIGYASVRKFLATPRTTWPYMLVMTFYAKNQRGEPPLVTGMGQTLPDGVESAAYSVDRTDGSTSAIYFRTYSHHLWDGVTPVTRVVYKGDRHYVWVCNPVPSNAVNTQAMYSTLCYVDGWCSTPLELALYANRMSWRLAPIVVVPVIDDPKQYVTPAVRHCVRELAQGLRARGARLIVAWNNQDVSYGQIGNDGVNPDLIRAYQENPDVYAFILHDHPGLRDGDLGLTDLHELSGRTDEDVTQYLDQQLSIARGQVGGLPVDLHYCGMFLNAENKISVDGIRIARTRGCCEVRGLCRVRTDSGGYVDVHRGFVRSDWACMPVYPSSSGCGSSALLEGQNWWLFRSDGTSKYVDPARRCAAFVESLLYAVVGCRIGKVCTWGHGINVAASRQGFVAFKYQPEEGTTLTISTGAQARAYEFRSVGDADPENIRVQIGSSLAETVKNLVSAIAANQPDASVYSSPVDSNDGYKMVLLTNWDAGDPIPVATTVSGAVTEPLAERRVVLDYLENSAFALADVCEGQITLVQ